MNENILNKIGFEKEAKLVMNCQCPFCGKIKIKEFKDFLSIKEFKISGLCQKCQDEIFN